MWADWSTIVCNGEESIVINADHSWTVQTAVILFAIADFMSIIGMCVLKS